MSQQLSQAADPIICHCLKVTESTVRDCITLLGATTVLEVKQSCGAGGGCMCCRRRIQCMIEARFDAQPRILQNESIHEVGPRQ